MKKMAVFAFLVLATNALSMPSPRLGPQHEELVGEWVYIKGYCENWTDTEIQQYQLTLQDAWYSEHLFINKWDMKFLQSQLHPESDQPPYEFCHRSIYYEPRSRGNQVMMRHQILEQNSECPISSLQGEHGHEITLNIKISQQEKLWARFTNWPGCENSLFKALYKRKK